LGVGINFKINKKMNDKDMPENCKKQPNLSNGVFWE
jgi:hypothetical protein